MSNYEYDTWLSQYPLLVRNLDREYGGPNNNKSFIRGRKILFNILEYLSTHKKSSCEDIAKNEYQKNPNGKRKIRSIIDYTRKFINNNLISTRIIKEDGFKKIYNKRVKTYSLTPFGILYSIHLNKKNTKSIAIEYKGIIPKIFEKFDFFEKQFGEEFIEIIGITKLADTGKSNANMPTVGILADFVNEMNGAYYSNPMFLVGRWVDQISFVIYCNILNHISWKSQFEHFETGKDFEIICQRKVKEFWNDIYKVDPGIRDWIHECVKEAFFVYSERKKILSNAKKWF